MAEKRTPTPWQVDEVRTQCGRAFRIGSGEMLSAGKGCCIIYDDYPGNPLNERSANAAFIVRAVNSHDKLVEVLKASREYLEGGNPLHTSGGHRNTDLRDQIDATLASLQTREGSDA